MTLLLYKSRVEPTQLIILKTLKPRISLSKQDQQNHYNLNKGYLGELQFDALLENLKSECIILNDLLLSFNNLTFQIDSLLILNNRIYLFEIKNYAGDYYYDSDSNRFFQKGRSEVSNPLIQLERTESLLRQLLLKYHFSIPIHSYVIFINPEFTLFQAPLDKPFLLPSQLNRFINNLNIKHLHLNEQHKRLADTLNSLNMKEHPLQQHQYPTYSSHELRKGIKCLSCESFSINIVNRFYLICSDCSKIESLESALIRTIKEFQILFPEEKITISKMFEWCNNAISQKTLRRILNKHFTKTGTNRWIYYT